MNKLYSGLLHTHEALVTLYFLIFTIKLVLLLINNATALANFRKKTKVIGEMVIPALFLIIGIYLATVSNVWGDAWFLLKFGLIILSVVTGVFTFRQNNKILGILTLLILVYVFILSYRKNPALKKEDTAAPTAIENVIQDPKAPGYDAVKHGMYLYEKSGCVACHGNNGSLGNHGAANLVISPLDDAAIENVIKNGRGNVMVGYGNKLSSDEIHAVAQYVKSFRHH